MNTKPTPEQIKEVAGVLSKDWKSTVETMTAEELEYYRVQMLSNLEVVIETQKRLIACGLVCFNKKDFESSTHFKRAAWLLSAFKAVATKKEDT